MEKLAFKAHDHSHCQSTALNKAKEQCAEQGLRLTKIREEVLKFLLQRHEAIGAYEIVDHLKVLGMSAKPPTAYRALDFLTQHGFVHRIEKLNAYIACPDPGHKERAAFLICNSCDRIAEMPYQQQINLLPKEDMIDGFTVESVSIEITGHCAKCQQATS